MDKLVALKDLLARFNSRHLKHFLPEYRYMFSPQQLWFLCECLTATKMLPGPILEIGCAQGDTTLFLNRHLDTLNVTKAYICLDTFEGFIEEDINYEVAQRGKSRHTLSLAFRKNRKTWFDRTMSFNNIGRVQSLQANANSYDFSRLENVSFCLVDVDLYLPVKNTLNGIYPRMAPGGIIVVDDCQNHPEWDGALEAFRGFVEKQGLPEKVVHDKLGVISIPTQDGQSNLIETGRVVDLVMGR